MSKNAASYRVGPGKPPLHSQFKKGQSGNPSGKPGPVKSMQARLKLALNSALHERTLELKHCLYQDTSLDEFVKRMVVSAAGGDRASMRLLLSLIEKLDNVPLTELTPSEDPEEQVADETRGDKSGTFSLPQGETQGGFQKKRNTGDGPTRAQIEDESGMSSLLQGKTQGRFAGEDSANTKSVAEQDVDRAVAPTAGKPDDPAGKPDQPARPKRPTIMVAGRVIQQGD